MKRYILGHYCATDVDVEVMNKNTNLLILRELRNAYPNGLNTKELANKTGLPEKTVYAQLRELNSQYFIEEQEEKSRPRGRPGPRSVKDRAAKYVIEDMTHNFNQAMDEQYQFAPGYVSYRESFLDAWHKVVEDKDRNGLNSELMHFVDTVYRRFKESKVKKIVELSPTTKDYICSSCGLNHEARDFVRAILLHMLDHLEGESKYLDASPNHSPAFVSA